MLWTQDFQVTNFKDFKLENFSLCSSIKAHLLRPSTARLKRKRPKRQLRENRMRFRVLPFNLMQKAYLVKRF